MSGVAKAGLAVVVAVPAFMVAALLFSPLALLATYGLDALIGQRTGCSIGTLEASISAHSAVGQVAVLLGRWLISFAAIWSSLWWLIAMVFMTWSGANEASHNMGRKHAGYSTATVFIVAISIPIYSQGMCLIS